MAGAGGKQRLDTPFAVIHALGGFDVAARKVGASIMPYQWHARGRIPPRHADLIRSLLPEYEIPHTVFGMTAPVKRPSPGARQLARPTAGPSGLAFSSQAPGGETAGLSAGRQVDATDVSPASRQTAEIMDGEVL
jgi:hypothetical protein